MGSLKLTEVVDSRVFHLGGRFHDITHLSLGRAELDRRAKHKLAVLRHVEEISGNVAATCRYYGISRQAYYGWLKRYEAEDVEGLREPSRSFQRTPVARRVI